MKSCMTTKDGGAIPLRGVEILGDVLGGHAHLRVRQRYQNQEHRPVEAVYIFPLPSDGTLAGFTISCAGRTVEGEVKDREEAWKSYDDALLDGHGAALVDQERTNVFTVQVGNLLPGEETIVEMRVILRLRSDEGSLRLMIPTLVAPRYVPGTPGPARTGHGSAEPSRDVPDADRVTPPIGAPDYGLRVELTFDVGRDVEVESPSHTVKARREGKKTLVTLAGDDVALDRDLVLLARGLDPEPLQSVAAHREGADGFVAVTVVPDLGSAPAAQLDVVFLVDVSGSMQGLSIEQARTALRLCLRHLRESDRFNVIAFSSGHTSLFGKTEPFTQKNLERADSWVMGLVADGGTELLAPLREAARQVPKGVVVLLTDGQVANEAQIAAEAKGPRYLCFGIGTNVSDALLRDLARLSGGAVEMIYPGERIDEKVVAQFARATARRVTGLSAVWSGVTVDEIALSSTAELVDGEPFTAYGKTRGGGVGELELRGDLDGKPFYRRVPIDLDGDREPRPYLGKLWAAERVRSLALDGLDDRRAKRMRERIVELGVTYGIATPFTSFVAIDRRTGERRTTSYPETRVVPVSSPKGWAAFAGATMGSMPMPSAGGSRSAPPPAMSAAPAMPMSKSLQRETKKEMAPSVDDLAAIFQQQQASGLWGGGSDEKTAKETLTSLIFLIQRGVGTNHPIYGAQVKKAIEATLKLAESLPATDSSRELLLSAAWLLAEGKRARDEIAIRLGGAPDPATLRARVDALAAR